MADDEVSASELRKRYMRGGTLGDDQLTAAQLRARHAIPSNSRGMFSCLTMSTMSIPCMNLDFSTGTDSAQKNNNSVVVVIVAILLIAGVLAFLFRDKLMN